MHLVPPPPRGLRGLIFSEHARLSDRLRALLVGLASRFGNYRSFWSGPRVTIGSLRSGEVRVALSVLYSFFDELALGQRYPALRAPSTPRRCCDRPTSSSATSPSTTSEALVAHNPDDLDRGQREGKVALIHCVEGGFHLGATEDEVTDAVRGSRAAGSPTSRSPTSCGATSRPTRLRSPSSPTGSTAAVSAARGGALEPGPRGGGGDGEGARPDRPLPHERAVGQRRARSPRRGGRRTTPP